MKNPAVLSKFQQKNSSSPVIFTGDRCEVTILKKLEKYGCLKVTETVSTIGVFDMVVDGLQSGMFLVGRIEMEPTDIENITVDGVEYVKLIFKKGDVFMKTTQVVVEEKLSFYVWVEYIKYANVLKAMSYEDQAAIFDKIRVSSGNTFPVDHAVYECIFAQLSRDPNDFTVLYRNTDMKTDFRRIPLSDVAHAARSTSARTIGAYFKEGVNASLVHDNDMNSPVEDLLRK